MIYVDFPFRIDSQGRTATTDRAQHIRDAIEQVLFTVPGERVNRPEFGSGLMQLVFGPSSEEVATATQLLVQAALQQTLGEAIEVEAVDVISQEETLTVTVQYVVRGTQQRQVDRFTRGGPP